MRVGVVAGLLLVTLVIAGCGGGGGGGTAQTLDDWLRALRALVREGESPNRFLVPKAPAVAFSETAGEIGRNVDDAASRFGAARDLPYAETKDVFCTWFAWYMETGRTLPSEEDFPGLILAYVYGQAPIFTSQQVRDAADLLRTSIERAQTESEQVQNLATAAACSLPTPT